MIKIVYKIIDVANQSLIEKFPGWCLLVRYDLWRFSGYRFDVRIGSSEVTWVQIQISIWLQSLAT